MSPYVQLYWNPVTDAQELLQFHFMQNAFEAGAIAAVVAGLVGYFMVLRAQTFAGHALSQVGFAGAAGALLLGVSPIAGLLTVGLGSAAGMGALEDKRQGHGPGDGVAVAGVFTFALGLGLLFLQLYAGQAENVYAILFGNALGIGDSDVLTIAVTAAISLAGLAFIARPLLFATLDPDVAAARGVPIRLLGTVFLVLVAAAVAEAVQVVGTLLIFSLLVTPAATAQRLTARPMRALGLSAVLGLTFMWVGIAIAYFAPYSVVGFYVTSLAFGSFLVVHVLTTPVARRLYHLPRWRTA